MVASERVPRPEPTPGFRVGPFDDPDRYEIGAPVEAGAEGVLYRGRLRTPTTRLELSVAVKALQPTFAGQVDQWAARWRDQVELLRSLQIPGLVAVREGFVGAQPHRAGTENPPGRNLYLVMNWVDGEPLDAWVTTHAHVDHRDALKQLLPVAVALDLMHGGQLTGGVPVVHRDIKPANLLMTEGGAVLVDFGLTRGMSSGQPLGPAGTPGYLAPEVLAGRDYTPAADRYAFGATVYFLLTGSHLPPGLSAEEVRQGLAQVPGELADRIVSMVGPDPAARPTALANWVAQLRQSSLGDDMPVAEVLPAPTPLVVPKATRRRRKPGREWHAFRRHLHERPKLKVLLTLLLLVPMAGAASRTPAGERAVGAVGLKPSTTISGPTPTTEPTTSSTLDPTTSVSPSPSPSPPPSPPVSLMTSVTPVTSRPKASSGSRIAFIRRTGPEDPAPKVYVMKADGSEQTEVAATTRGSDLRWSPDGTRFAFADVGGIYVMNADGTGERRVSTGDAGMGPSWSPDGTRLIYRSLEGESGIDVVNADGTGQRRLTDGEASSPAWSPDGNRIAFWASGANGSEIFVMNLDGGARRQLTSLGGFSDSPAWSPDGAKIVFRHNSELMVVGAGGGGPRSLASPGGTGAVNPQGSGANKLATAGGDPGEPSWSPDGSRIAYTIYRSGQQCAIWVMNADGSGQAPVTDGSRCDGYATWQPTPR